MVLFKIRMPLWAALLPVSFFAIFHGYTHGAEMPNLTAPLLYVAGFVLSTGLLHLSGIAIGGLWKWNIGQWVVHGVGAVIALLGAYFLVS